MNSTTSAVRSIPGCPWTSIPSSSTSVGQVCGATAAPGRLDQRRQVEPDPSFVRTCPRGQLDRLLTQVPDLVEQAAHRRVRRLLDVQQVLGSSRQGDQLADPLPDLVGVRSGRQARRGSCGPPGGDARSARPRWQPLTDPRPVAGGRGRLRSAPPPPRGRCRQSRRRSPAAGCHERTCRTTAASASTSTRTTSKGARAWRASPSSGDATAEATKGASMPSPSRARTAASPWMHSARRSMHPPAAASSSALHVGARRGRNKRPPPTAAGTGLGHAPGMDDAAAAPQRAHGPRARTPCARLAATATRRRAPSQQARTAPSAAAGAPPPQPPLVARTGRRAQPASRRFWDGVLPRERVLSVTVVVLGLTPSTASRPSCSSATGLAEEANPLLADSSSGSASARDGPARGRGQLPAPWCSRGCRPGAARRGPCWRSSPCCSRWSWPAVPRIALGFRVASSPGALRSSHAVSRARPAGRAGRRGAPAGCWCPAQLVAGLQRPAVSAQHLVQDGLDLHARHVQADALVHAATEGDPRVGVLVGGLAAGCEAGRVERVGVVPHLRVAVRHERRDHDEGALGHVVAEDRGVAHGAAHHDQHGRDVAQCLLLDEVDRRQAVEVLPGQVVAADRVGLGPRRAPATPGGLPSPTASCTA